MQRWELWIDESGDFDRPVDTVVVAGLLRQGDFNGVAARKRVEAASPGVPWPPHAAWLRPLTMQLVYAQRAGVRLQAGDTLLALQRGLPRLLEVLSHHAATGEVLPKGTFDRLPAADRVIWETDSRLATRLQERRESMFAGLAGVLRDMAIGTGSIETYWVAGTERVPGSPVSGSKRYLALLELVVQRTRDLLGGLEGPHQLQLNVLRRPELNVTRLEELARGLKPHPFGDDAADVEVRSRVYDFGPTVSAWGVLADFAANAFRHLLGRSEPKGIDEVETLSLNRLRVTSARLAGQLPPHLGFRGASQDAIEAARGGDLTAAWARLEDAMDGPKWTVEQAEQWVRAWI